MAYTKTYSPQTVTISAFGRTLTGWNSVKVTRAEDAFSTVISADGTGSRTRNANLSGTIEIVCPQHSAANAILSAQALLDEQGGDGTGSVSITDLATTGALAFAEHAWVQKPADFERQKEQQDVTWTLGSDRIQIKHAGLVGA